MRIGVIITPERKREKIEKSLNELGVDYEFINLLSDDWDRKFQQDYDGFLIYPPSFPSSWKSIFLKRLVLLEDILKNRSLPSLNSIMIYESKVSMHDFLKLNDLPHIDSHSFFNYQKALRYGENCRLPVVVKEDGGSGAIGVKVINNRRQLIRLIRKSFLINNKIRKYNGIKSIKQAIKNKLYPYKLFIDSGKQYLPKSDDDFAMIHIQSYIKIKCEWRIIRIGDNFFGHKKLEDKKGFHSGSLNKGWGHVNFNLLDLVKKWSDSLCLESMCFDVFEDYEGNYYINELQVMFGTSTNYQLKVDGQPGRYLYDGEWVFEKGDFARNGCNNLRVELLARKLKS